MPGRIRTLKPELLEDEKTAGLPDDAFRLFVSLILLADDYGNARANAIWLKGQVWWCLEHSGDIPEMLRRLSGVSLITVYEVNGQSYLHVNGWEKHQKISHKGKPRIPSIKESLQKHSGDRPDDFRPDLRPHTTDRIPPTESADARPRDDTTVEEQRGEEAPTAQQCATVSQQESPQASPAAEPEPVDETLSPKSKATLEALLAHWPDMRRDPIMAREVAVKLTLGYPTKPVPRIIREAGEKNDLNTDKVLPGRIGGHLWTWCKGWEPLKVEQAEPVVKPIDYNLNRARP